MPSHSNNSALYIELWLVEHLAFLLVVSSSSVAFRSISIITVNINQYELERTHCGFPTVFFAFLELLNDKVHVYAQKICGKSISNNNK